MRIGIAGMRSLGLAVTTLRLAGEEGYWRCKEVGKEVRIYSPSWNKDEVRIVELHSSI